LEQIGPILRKHNGFIDKYIGDAIMALFPNGPEDAIQSAIAIRKYLENYNSNRISNQLPPINIGFGIHTGSMILGTIGELERMESTVISDAVNLGSRLEGLTKIYGVTILVSDYSMQKLIQPKQYHYRKIDQVKVKGKVQIVSITEIFDGDSPEILALKQKSKELFEQAVIAFELNDFNEAKRLFEQVYNIYPEDGPTLFYIEKLKKYEA
jgi:class 3 adenylate cyclase